MSRQDPSANRLRRRGLLAGLGVVVLGTILNKGLGHELTGRVLVLLGAFMALVAQCRPQWLKMLDRS
jgi:hypothetical protein